MGERFVRQRFDVSVEDRYVSLDEGQGEFVGHECLVEFVCVVLTDPGYSILLTTMSTALTACEDQ